ncbi:hypothetical protein Aperf_G00000086028 [Anoplocephala perfoliata]
MLFWRILSKSRQRLNIPFSAFLIQKFEDVAENASEPEDLAALLTESCQGAIEFLFEIGTWLTLILNRRRKNLRGLKWQSLLIQSVRWRQTIYELAQQPRNEDCVFLSLAMPLIAENFIDELVSVPMAWGTLGICLNCVNYTLNPLLTNLSRIMDDGLFFFDIAFVKLSSSNPSASQQQNQQSTHHQFRDTALGCYIIELEADPGKKADMRCHSEATYLMLQSVLQCLIRRRNHNAARHLSWPLESEARRRGCDLPQ